MFVLAALTPLIAVFGLLVVLRLPAARAMPLALVMTAAVAYLVWQVPARRIAAASLEGLLIAASILWIVFGAIFLLNVLRQSGALTAIRDGFSHVTPDSAAQVILIAWLFGAFLEGAAGFGTPAAIIAPLLVALGHTPMAAVVLALVADSSPVSYGAIGTPVVIGLAQGLQPGGVPAPGLAEALGGGSLEAFIASVAVRASLFDLFIGSAVPLVLLVILGRFVRPRAPWWHGLRAWRFALVAGLAFTLPALAVAWAFGPEFPSLIGALIGLAIMVPVARKGWLLPDTGASGAKGETAQDEPAMALWRAWSPYVLLALVLVLTRLDALPLKAWLQDVTVSWGDILGTGIAVAIAPLYSPAASFVAVALAGIALFGMRPAQIRGALREGIRPVIGSALALGASVATVRVFLQTDVNAADLPSMPMELAIVAADAAGATWPIFAPLVGAIGAFLSGSATFSNMMFALFQFSAAERAEVSAHSVLAAQMLGANAGNMVSVVNVVAAAAVVGLIGREGQVIRHTLAPMLAYALLAGFIAWMATDPL
ncbi:MULTISPECIES: L-lactate permease [unclassified Roseitalea]|uniref:L-lactate permease n=1 Tax=unclassified Roseitalea TaxID=2639107 RepID=UPI00273D483D|nr:MULTISPECIES: L-lactate permease [unclassified Roseitalea]